MPSTKDVGLSYPTHFLKRRGSVIMNNFLEYRANKATNSAQRNGFYALLAINKAKHILNSFFSCFCSDTSYSKGIKKKVPFLKVYNISFIQHFSECKGGSRVSSDHIIYFAKK